MKNLVQKRVAAAVAAAVMLAAAPAIVRAQTPPAAAPAPAADADGALDVTVTYKGKGDVSPKNEISVFVFSDPNINESSMPIGVGAISENGGHVLINGLPPVVYIAVFYDDQGTYKRDSAPPPGTPVSIHGMAASGAAEPVKTGKGAKVSVTFDDSQRM
jgi:hypothetical protein